MTEDIRLLRSLVEWRRANGWVFERSDAGYVQWTGRDGWSVDVYLPGGAEMTVESATRRFGVWYPLTVTAAVDVLAALDVLPVGFSSAYRAGRESAYTEDEWRVCGGPANKELPEEFQFPYIYADGIAAKEEAVEELAQARRYWRGEESWIEQRRTGATDWSRVDADA